MRTINDEIGLKTNLQWQCGNCKTLNDVAEKVCHKCGLPKNKFLEAMSKRTDEQLQEILDSPPGDYQPEAIEAAKQEIKKRKLIQGENPIPTVWHCKQCETENPIKSVTCSNCGAHVMFGPRETTNEQDISLNYELSPNNAPESALGIIATIVLVCGIIISAVLIVFGIVQISDFGGMAGWITIFSIIPVLLSSIVIWALLRVFSNISINVREIKEKLK